MKKLKTLRQVYLKEAYSMKLPLKQKLETCKMLEVELVNMKIAMPRVTLSRT